MKVLIIGINSQDGMLLARILLKAGWEVAGVGSARDPRIELTGQKRLIYFCVSKPSTEGLERCLSSYRPTHIVHCTAIHGPSGFNYTEYRQELAIINEGYTAVIVEFLRRCGGRFIYFSSSKVFDLDNKMVDEKSALVDRCDYSYHKNLSTKFIQRSRKSFGIDATVIWFFNHESTFRSDKYFLPKLAKYASLILMDRPRELSFEMLNFYGNWGWASEFMRLTSKVLCAKAVGDIVMSSPSTVYVPDLICALGEKLNISNDLQRDLNQQMGLSPVNTKFGVSTDKLKRLTGYLPKFDAHTCLHALVRHYCREARMA